MPARHLILFYPIVSYAIFFASSLYAIMGFVGNYLVAKSIDAGGAAGAPR